MVSAAPSRPVGDSGCRRASEDSDGTEAELGDEESILPVSKSKFSQSCTRMLKDHQKIFRPTTSTSAEDGSPVEDRLQALDEKLDHLTQQMGECLAGIRVLYLRWPRGGTNPAPRTTTSVRRPCSDRVRQSCQNPLNDDIVSPRGDVEMPFNGESQRTSVNSSVSAQSRLRMEEVFGPARPDPTSPMSNAFMRGDGTSSVTGLFRNLRNSLSMNVDQPRDETEPAAARLSAIFARGRSASNVAAILERGCSDEEVKSRVSRPSYTSRSPSWIAKRQRTQGNMSRMVWNLLDNPDSSIAARLYNRVMPLLILTAVALSLAHALFPDFLAGTRMVVAEMFMETIFFIEIATRFIVCPNRWVFFRSIYNIIDMMSAVPLILRVIQYIEAGVDIDNRSLMYVLLIGFVPSMRLLKTWRRFQQIHLLTKAFRLAFEALPVMLFIYFVVWLFFTALVFVAEDRGNIETLGAAMWLTFCSMTASMFGDVYPMTVQGKIIVACLVLISTLYMAIPIGIIGSCFSEVWAARDRILLVESLRRVFKQNGFSATDIPDLFAHFDIDQTGLLTLEDFTNMAQSLKLGLSKERLLSLFQMLDDDNSGGIDDREFCRAVFPEAFHFLYAVDADADDAVDHESSMGPLLSMGRRFSTSMFPSFLLSSRVKAISEGQEGQEAEEAEMSAEDKEEAAEKAKG